MVADYPLPIRAYPHRNVPIRLYRKENLMSDEKPKRRTLAEIVRELVHSGNHVDLKADADALAAETTETTSDEGDGEKNVEES
jgi:hypothetical protein